MHRDDPAFEYLKYGQDKVVKITSRLTGRLGHAVAVLERVKTASAKRIKRAFKRAFKRALESLGLRTLRPFHKRF